jgi:hypothetical protein
MKFNRNFLLNATLLQALTVPMLLIPSYAQQEVDPTWHDPWAITAAAPAQPAQPVVANTQKPEPTRARNAAPHKKQVVKQEAHATPQPHRQETKVASAADTL